MAGLAVLCIANRKKRMSGQELKRGERFETNFFQQNKNLRGLSTDVVSIEVKEKRKVYGQIQDVHIAQYFCTTWYKNDTYTLTVSLWGWQKVTQMGKQRGFRSCGVEVYFKQRERENTRGMVRFRCAHCSIFLYHMVQE